VPKKDFSKFFKKKIVWSDFLEFLIFCLNLGLNLHIHLFFQLSSCTGWITIKDFPIFQRKLFSPFFGPFHFSWDVFFDKSNPDPLLLTVDRSWESCWIFVMTFQLSPKNWQSSVTSLKKCAFFLGGYCTLNKVTRLIACSFFSLQLNIFRYVNMRGQC
jgi:hypothetical protein